MAKDLMDYNKLVDSALRTVVGQALRRAAREGLPGSHHFYISFRTNDPGVDIPEYLHAKYPEEMTIVIQHQFWGLEIDEVGFEVTLSFRKSPERLKVPFAALTGFFDPSVQFGLQFKGEGADAGSAQVARPLLEPTKTPSLPGPKPAAAPAEEAGAGGGKVVTLDQFRKK